MLFAGKFIGDPEREFEVSLVVIVISMINFLVNLLHYIMYLKLKLVGTYRKCKQCKKKEQPVKVEENKSKYDDLESKL